MSVEDYHRMLEAGILTEDDKVELIKGEIIEMSPIGSKHAACVNRLTKILIQGSEEEIVSGQNPVTIPPNSEPEPDLVWLKPRADHYIDAHPAADDIILLIEVSLTTLVIDQQIKLPLYAEAKIPIVWIVNLNDNEIIEYRNPYEKQYLAATIHPAGSEIMLPHSEKIISVDKILGL